MPPLDFLLCLWGEPPNKEAVGKHTMFPGGSQVCPWPLAQKRALKSGRLWTSIGTRLHSYFAALASYVEKKKKKASDSISFITLMTQNHFR